MNPSREDPIVHMRRLFPVGPPFTNSGPPSSRMLVPFGVRQAVPSSSGIVTVGKNGPTQGTEVSVNQQTSNDGNYSDPAKMDDVPVASTD